MNRVDSLVFCLALAACGGARAASCPLPSFQRGADVAVPSSGAETLIAGDINNDGKTDLVSRTNGNAIQVMLGDGGGQFTLLAPLALSEFSAFGLGDLNRDGKTDLVVATVGGLSTYLGRGDGTFSLYTLQAAGGVIGGVPGSANPNQRFLWGDMQLFDLDGDGHLDVIGADHIGQRILVLFGAADGIPRNRPVGIAMGGLVAGFVAFYPPANAIGPRRGAIGFAAMTGNQLGVREYTTAISSFFFSTVTKALTETPFRVAVADLDNDGKPELIASDFQGAAATVLDAQSNFGQAVAKVLPLSHRIENLAVADFNGDGLPDLVGANRGGELVVFAGQTGKAFGPGQVVAAGSWFTGIAIADFNRDGALDIAAVDKAGGRVALVLNRCIAAPADLAIAAVEVVQNLQDSANSVPLVAGRRSFVRVLTTGNAVVPGMDGRVTRIDLQGQPLGAPLQPVNQGAAILQPLAPSRQRLDDTLLFELPADWLAAGTLRLQVDVNSSQRLPEVDMANNRRTLAVTFAPSQPLPVTLVRLKWLSNGTPTATKNTEPELARAELLRRMPVPTLDVIDREIDYQFDDMGITSGPLNANWLPDVRNWNATFEPAEKRLYYFLAQGQNSGLQGGVAADIGARAAVGSANVVAHELGHALGLRHVDPALELNGAACDMAAGAGLYPYPGGAIGGPANDAERYVGLDAGAYVAGVAAWAGTRVVSSRAGDEMSYCKEKWFSDFSIRKLIGEIDLRFALAPPTLWLADLGGDTPLPAPAAAELPEPGDWLNVFGTLGTGKQPALRWRALRTDTLGQRPAQTTPRWRVRVRAADGSLLADTECELSAAGDMGGGIAFRAVVPFPPNAARIELVDTLRDALRGTLKISRSAPRVQGLAAVSKTDATGRQQFELRWRSADRDGDALRHVVLASGDEGQRWRVVAVNVAGNDYRVAASALPAPAGSAPVRFRVLASDGVLTGRADSADLRVDPLPPTLAITAPAPGLQVLPGQSVTLQALARESDRAAQPLPQVSWRSDRDGAIGSGVLAHFTPHTPGVHVVTGTARSAAGLAVHIERTVFVDSQAGRTLVQCVLRGARLLAVGGIDSAGQRWQREVVAVIADIGAGTRYQVAVAGAARIDLAVVRPATRRAYLRAPRDAQAANNLASLPACGR